MTKYHFFREYNRLNGADGTLVFFEYKDGVYIYKCHHIMPRWAKSGYESSSKGGHQKFKMYIKVAERAKLVAKGAIKVMTTSEFKEIPYKNKGYRCEYWLHKVCNLGEYTPDHRRFDECGDVCINGVQYQVKFQNASLTNVVVLHKAQKKARETKKAVV